MHIASTKVSVLHQIAGIYRHIYNVIVIVIVIVIIFVIVLQIANSPLHKLHTGEN